jgi:hypothetical protein
MLDTATAVYEAVEPLVIWRTLFEQLKAGMEQENGQVGLPNVRSERQLIWQPSELFSWLLSSIRQHEEEIVSLHIPIVLNSLLEHMIVSGNH